MTDEEFPCVLRESCVTPDWVITRIAEVEARLNLLASEEPANSIIMELRNSAIQLSSVRRALSRSSRRARED